MTNNCISSDGVAKSVLMHLDCPRSLTVFLLLKHNEIQQVVNLTIDPEDYIDAYAFRDAYLATKILSKQNFIKSGIDLRQVAIDGFYEAEQKCKLTNRFFSEARSCKTPGFDYVLNACSRKIRKILGDFNTEEMLDDSNWGPGVSLDVKRDTSGTNKFRLEGGTTELSHDFISKITHLAYPAWMPVFRVHKGNKIVTVPKNAKTDRVIAVEPGINLWFQKGIGTMIRKRLKRAGVDLKSQKRNQELCKVASITGHLATVDFSAASDTISRSVVRELLPHDWFGPMCVFRSPVGQINESEIRYEKFSSMGNGYTFELESLIFFALATSVCEYLGLSVQDVSVYGDDVIIPTEAYRLFATISGHFGFTVNLSKSYSTGYFRESCGVHYYNGIDCKPLYIKEDIRNEIEIYKLANGIRRLAHRSYSSNYYSCCDRRFYNAWLSLVSLVKHEHRCLISEHFGDGGFIVNFDEAVPSKARHGIEGYYAKALVSSSRKYFSDDLGLYLNRLRNCSVREYGNFTDSNVQVKSTRKRILIHRWFDLGPWI